jgi:hypothetical protein
MTPEQELERFLFENPHLYPLQRKIDRILNSVPDNKRNTVMLGLILDNLDQLSTELKLLQLKLNEKL